MIEILYNKLTNTLEVSVEETGGVIYVYRNRKFILSRTSSSLVTNIVIVVEEGDTIYCNYFKNGVVSDYSNSITVISDLLEVDEFTKNPNFPLLFSSNDPEILLWKENLLKKLQVPGVLLNRYLLGSSDSEDFLSFWSSVVHFLLFYTKFSKLVAQGLLGNNKDILSTYLRQRGYFLSLDETDEELKEIQSNLYFEIAKRGTLLPFLETQLNYLKQGEFFKLIRKDTTDEFLFNLYRDKDFGWNLNNSSPLYRGLEREISLDKFDENNLPYELVRLNDKILLSQQNELDTSDLHIEKGIFVSSSLDYLLQLDIQGEGEINLGLVSYDIDGNRLDYLTDTTGVVTNYFLTNFSIERRFFIKAIVFNYLRGENLQDKLNIGVGNNLVYNQNVHRVVPVIEVISGNLEISNIHFSPLFTPYDRGFVQVNNVITSFYKNNSKLDREEVDYRTQKYLLPYHTHWISSDTTKEYLSQFPCQNTETPNWQPTGRVICDKKAGVNSGKYSIEEIDINPCTSQGSRLVESGFDFEKCPYCLPNGVEVTVGAVTCDCLTVSVESFGCACNEITVDSISCVCEV